jgi:predicted dehydrogenase
VVEPLKVGIAGYGVVGKRRRHFIDQRIDMRTVAVCDQALPTNGPLPDGVRGYRHYSDLLGESLDVLFVCLTNDIAAEVTVAGMKNGLHVFCEKPPGRNITDIARVIDCARQHPHLKLKYGFNHRYHDSVRDALAIVRSGNLGRIINIRGVYGKSTIIDFRSPTHWRTKRALAGGGILLDQGIHMVDLMRLFAGEFVDVQSFVSNDFWRHDVEDNAYALMRTKDGIIAMLHSSATSWRHRFEFDITLERGTVILSGILSGSKSYGEETLTVARVTLDDAGTPKEEVTRYVNDPSWADEIADFAESIAQNRPIVDGSAAEALATMQLVYRIYCADADWKARWKLDDSITMNPRK